MNFAESGYLMAPDECLREAERQFAIAEAVGRRHYMAPLWARGGWFMLLRWAELTAPAGSEREAVSDTNEQRNEK